jgi:phosphatidate cytidylyltransferase
LASALAEPARRWGDLRRRGVSALALAVPGLVVIWYGGSVFDVLIGVLTAGLWLEWAGLCRRRDSPGLLIVGLVWIALGAAAAVWLRGDASAGRANVLFLALLVWATDIGAYAAGRAIGGPRLAPRISPGKTWTGAAGGLLAAGVVGLLAAASRSGQADWLSAVAVAAGLSAIGQAGDLAESWMKRRAGVKDSGHLIPGHGGLLDRLDAAWAVLPAGALLALLLGRGVVLWQ